MTEEVSKDSTIETAPKPVAMTKAEVSQGLLNGTLKFYWSGTHNAHKHKDWNAMKTASITICWVNKNTFSQYINKLVSEPSEGEVEIKWNEPLPTTGMFATLMATQIGQGSNYSHYHNLIQQLIDLNDGVDNGHRLLWGMTRQGARRYTAQQWAQKMYLAFLDEIIAEFSSHIPRFDFRIWEFQCGTQPNVIHLTDVRPLDVIIKQIKERGVARKYCVMTPHTFAPCLAEDNSSSVNVFRIPLQFPMPTSGGSITVPVLRKRKSDSKDSDGGKKPKSDD